MRLPSTHWTQWTCGKMHLDMDGKMEEIDAEMCKWLIAGSVMSHDEHQAAARDIGRTWRAARDAKRE